MKRRDFLIGGAAAAGAALLPNRAWGAWGEAPPTTPKDLLFGAGVRAERCLELYLYGGLASFHTFYAVDEYGRSNDADPALRNTQFHAFDDDKRSVWGNDCGEDPSTWLTPFGTDSLGMTVNFTPVIRPLLDRPDILSRCRVVVLRHDFQPHEIAIPYMMTGQRLGSPRMAGLGTHVQRYWNERDTSGRVVPYSYVFSPEGASPIYNIAAASAVGAHPGSSRPLHLFTSANTDIGELIGRRYLGDDITRVDPLLDYYAKRSTTRYADAQGTALRSRAIEDHQFSIASLINAPNLQDILTPELFTVGSSNTCGLSNASDVSKMTIDAGISLLTHPTTPAKYVNVVDGGNVFYGDLPYDTHSSQIDTITKNLRHSLRALAARINEPGENDPTKLDLDDTMVLINAEFGRTAIPQGGDVAGGGGNHFPFGFVALMIGGPATSGVYGAIGPDGYSVDYLTPSEYRAAALAALGIYPFSAQSFAVGDIRNVATEADALAWLNTVALGRSS
ncbi:MAG: DUF1501 domain-containing protein [Myxococcota bacterium]